MVNFVSLALLSVAALVAVDSVNASNGKCVPNRTPEQKLARAACKARKEATPHDGNEKAHTYLSLSPSILSEKAALVLAGLPPVAKAQAPKVSSAKSKAVVHPVAPVATAPAPSTAGLTSFDLDCLTSHNTFRRESGKNPVSWSTSLQASAQVWANHLASLDDGSGIQLPHSGGPDGENLFGARASTPSTCGQAVARWFAEKPAYPVGGRIDIDGNFEAYGHYTQLIWGTTTKIGCAIGTKSIGGQVGSYVVCHYDPAGNVIGEVLP
ncbi:hypothetical protein HKX48_006069 [Thoreauomyces humboldtii]|nr:hypothetical protein HKX48_006069 [Thoreauomyces humboldtii]